MYGKVGIDFPICIGHYFECSMDNADNAWLCLTLLKRIGVDVEEWEREVEKNDTKRSDRFYK